MATPVTVVEFLGNPVTVGVVASVVTEAVKYFPSFLTPVVKGNKWAIQAFVALVALGLNVAGNAAMGYELATPDALYATFTSFFVALGAYNFVIKDIGVGKIDVEVEAK